MAKKKSALQLRDEAIPNGYGRLASVTPFGSKGDEVLLWYEDTSGTLRAIRVRCNSEKGLGLEIAGQAMVSRT